MANAFPVQVGDTEELVHHDETEGAIGEDGMPLQDPTAENGPRRRVRPTPRLEDYIEQIEEMEKKNIPIIWEDAERQRLADQENEDDEDVFEGTCCERCMHNGKQCVTDAWAGCTSLDKALFFMHIVIALSSVGQIIAVAKVKIVSHNQCLLRGSYESDGTMISGEKYWCDSALYYSLVSMSLVFMFVMVNWTAQLNNNWHWMKVELLVTILGLLGEMGTGGMFGVSYMSWCEVLRNAMHCNPEHTTEKECTKARQNIKTCKDALRYFDDQINHESLLQTVDLFSMVAMIVMMWVVLMWVILLVLVIMKFCQIYFDVMRKREKEAAENAELEEEERNREPYDPSQGPPDIPHPFEIQCMAQEHRRRKALAERLAQGDENVDDLGGEMWPPEAVVKPPGPWRPRERPNQANGHVPNFDAENMEAEIEVHA